MFDFKSKLTCITFECDFSNVTREMFTHQIPMSIYDDTNLGDHPYLKFAISLYFYSYITHVILKKKKKIQ